MPEFAYSGVATAGRVALWGIAAGCLVLVVPTLGCAGGSATKRAIATPQESRHDDSRPVERDEHADDAGVGHVVQRGQTLWRIGRVYGVDVEELAAANGIDDPSELETGQVLYIPGAEKVLDVPVYPAPLDDVDLSTPPTLQTVDSGEWLWPVKNGRILSGYGAARRKHRHKGIDISGRAGQQVRAARAGRVVYSGSSMRGYGRTVILDHGDGTRSLYAHNSSLLVRTGQRVERGQPIARVGRSGNATVEHCHFEIRDGDRPVDPLPYLRPKRKASR